MKKPSFADTGLKVGDKVFITPSNQNWNSLMNEEVFTVKTIKEIFNARIGEVKFVEKGLDWRWVYNHGHFVPYTGNFHYDDTISFPMERVIPYIYESPWVRHHKIIMEKPNLNKEQWVAKIKGTYCNFELKGNSVEDLCLQLTHNRTELTSISNTDCIECFYMQDYASINADSGDVDYWDEIMKEEEKILIEKKPVIVLPKVNHTQKFQL